MVSSDERCVEMMMVILRSANSLQAIEEFGFAARIEMRGRLVQEQDFRIADQDAGKADRLLLAAGQAAPAFGDRACRSLADARR